MRKLFVFWVMILLLLPCKLFAQKDKNEKSYTIVEETVTDSMTIVTTTVVEKKAVFTNGFWHNWDFSVGIGPHVYMGENDNKTKTFTERIAFPAVDVYITKWASPSIGISAGATFGGFKGLYQSAKISQNWYYGANYKTDERYYDADPKWDYMELAQQRAFYFELYALAHLDLCSAIGGYNPERFYTADCYAGGGVMFGFDEGGVIHSGAFNAGIINKFRLTKQVRLMITVRGALIADDFDGELYVQEPSMAHRLLNINMDGSIGVTAGVSILLGKRKSQWYPASRTTELIRTKEIEERTDTITLVDVQKVIPEVWFHINFQVDRWDLSNKEKVNLHAVADVMKSTPGVRYLVCGYADKQTATSTQNLMLSERRANAVFDFLVDVCGIDPEILVLDYKGGVDYMYYDEKELSRCVMITAIKE